MNEIKTNNYNPELTKRMLEAELADGNGLLGNIDCMYHIFSRLSPEEIFLCRRVCKLWYQVGTAQLNMLFPVLDRRVWEACPDFKELGLEFDPKMELRITAYDWKTVIQMRAEVEEDQGITIITIPKGLSLGILAQIATGCNTRIGNAERYRQILDIKTERSFTVAVTNGVFKNSRNIKAEEHLKLVSGLHCEMPRLFAVASLAILTFKGSQGKRLYGTTPPTATRLAELFGEYRMFFGWFNAQNGAFVGSCNIGLKQIGVGGQYELKGIEERSSN